MAQGSADSAQWQHAAGASSITFSAEPGVTCIAEKSAPLVPGSWLPVVNNGTGNVLVFTVPDESPRLYLRARVTNP